LQPEEVTYHTNKAAVYFEQKNYDECINCIDAVIEIASHGNYDYAKLGKALSRKANALKMQGKYDEAVDWY